MRSNNAVLTILLGLTTLAPACGDGVLTGPSEIVGGVWKLRSIESEAGSITGIPNPTGYTLEFKDGGALAVRADCNSCSGGYSVSADVLQVSPLACTRAFCGSASYDTAFLKVLNGGGTFGVLGIELSIESTEGTLRLNR